VQQKGLGELIKCNYFVGSLTGGRPAGSKFLQTLLYSVPELCVLIWILILLLYHKSEKKRTLGVEKNRINSYEDEICKGIMSGFLVSEFQSEVLK
jgi:hypothetical protein